MPKGLRVIATPFSFTTFYSLRVPQVGCQEELSNPPKKLLHFTSHASSMLFIQCFPIQPENFQACLRFLDIVHSLLSISLPEKFSSRRKSWICKQNLSFLLVRSPYMSEYMSSGSFLFYRNITNSTKVNSGSILSIFFSLQPGTMKSAGTGRCL